MNHLSDIELVQECVLENRYYQEVFYKKYSQKMYNLCLAYTSSHDDAKDVMQDGFVKVFTSLKQYQGNGSLEGWVRKIIVNTAIDFYRKKSKEIKNINIEDVHHLSYDVSVLDTLHAKHLIDLIHKLPEGANLIFNLYVIEGYSHEEIAKKLNISIGTSKSQLSRAKSLLINYIEKFSVEKTTLQKI